MDYELAKEKLPDWTQYCSEQLKSELKVLVLRWFFSTHNPQEIKKRADKEIQKFTKHIDDREVAKNFYNSLMQFVEELIQNCQNSLGSMTAFQVAMALKKSLTETQKNMLSDVAKNQAVFNLPKEQPQILATTLQNAKIDDTAYNRATAATTYYKDVQSQVKGWLKTYKDQDRPKGYIYSSSERSYAEMSVRYQAYLQNKKSLQEQGVRFVVVPSHANCSKRCQPFQGRVYSLDGTSGSIDGRNYIPIEDVSDKVTYTSPRTGRTYFAGLFSYNCRHFMEPYKEGMNIETIPDEVIERQRSLEEQQRAIERAYRKGRENYFILNEIYKKSKDDNIRQMMVKQYRSNVALRKNYVIYCEKNNLVEYRDRLKLIVADGGNASEIASNIQD